MPAKLRIVYLAHSIRSDWNNGNAHFLRGLLRALHALGHEVLILEPERGWSIDNLRDEPGGEQSLTAFHSTYPELHIETYGDDEPEALRLSHLQAADIVILHEWNPPALAQRLLALRDQLGFRLLFHDTHHRASSSPEQIAAFGLHRFDGVVVFGEALRSLYRERFHLSRVWTLHEAADTTVFFPGPAAGKDTDVVWIGNWGEGERTAELREFLLEPASRLRHTARFTIHGVRYPEDGLAALRDAGIHYAGYLPNLDAPEAYARARLTLHVPRQQYTQAMTGIPTIRVFEALACGIPLVSAPWQDSEALFRPGDLTFGADATEMTAAIQHLLANPQAAADQAHRGRETVLARHTCHHRAQELTAICEEVPA